MKQYLLSVIVPVGEPPPPDDLARIRADVEAFDQEMKDKGVWVFNGALHEPSSATVLRPDGDDVLVTDGPFIEGKEFLGGFAIIRVEDLDAALEWGRKAMAATTLPIEVRPFQT